MINLRHYCVADPGGKLEVKSMHEELSGYEAKCCINCAVSLCQQHCGVSSALVVTNLAEFIGE